ncbi:TerD family protein [Streptomyces chartreusis]|uniref:TerD family protein n=1 Tax=Streptomyces chartreusis TaxID=1969 RepID=UPI003D8A9270
MPELSKGGNIAMGPGPVVAELHAVGGTVDLSALLVAADGKVRSDDDLVFYNQPSAESDAVRHVAADAAGGERIEVDPAALPADVDRVVLVGSCDPDDASRTFREVKDVLIRASQPGADPVHFRPPALTDGERAVLLVELYRRGEGWKLRGPSARGTRTAWPGWRRTSASTWLRRSPSRNPRKRCRCRPPRPR